jgi:hypothetical protein
MSGQRRYRILLEKEPGSTTVSLVIPTDATDDLGGDLGVDELAELLHEVFADDLRLEAVAIKQGVTRLGTVRRERLLQLTQPGRTALEGDGATLPGESRQYRALQYSCRAEECRAAEWHVIRPSEPPSCPDGHGPLEYMR